MELRYMGFEQRLNRRAYNFDGLAKGQAIVHFVITADLALFAKHHIGIQEGPSLCARKLAADLDKPRKGDFELLNEDLLAYATARADAETRRAEMRRTGARRRTAASASSSV